MAKDAYELQGQNGGIALTGNTSWTRGQNGADERPVRWISFLSDTVVSSLTNTIIDLETVLPAMALVPAGTGVGGSTTQYAQTSGEVILYY